MSSINLDLDFQDYSPSSSNVRTIPQQQQQPDVQVRFPTSSSDDPNLRQKLQGAKQSVLQNVLQNLQSGQTTFTDEAIQQLISMNKQKTRQQQRSGNNGGGWGLGYLAQYFDVTTNDVVERILWSAVPYRKRGFVIDDFNDSELTESLTSNMENPGDSNASTSEMNSRLLEQINASKQRQFSYMERFIQSRPDFYGPFWISVTLVFALGIFSNLVSFMQFQSKFNQAEQQAMKNATISAADLALQMDAMTEDWHYSMDELSMATSVVMWHVTLLPTFLWFFFWFRGCTKYYTLSETICTFGYSLSIFIPAAALLMIQATFFRYIVIVSASTLSGLVLMMSFLPVIRSDPDKKGTHLILIIVAACQFGLAYILHRIMLQ